MSLITTSSYEPRNLFAGSEMPKVTEGITLEGQGSDVALAAGTVLAKKSNDKCVVVDTAVTGAEVPYAVLAEDIVVLASTDIKAPIYSTGEFNENKLVFGGSDTIDTHRVKLRELGIYAKKLA